MFGKGSGYGQQNQSPSTQPTQTPAEAVAARNPGAMPQVNLGMNINQNNQFSLSDRKEIDQMMHEVRKRLLQEFNVVQSETRLLAAIIDGTNAADLM